MVLSGRLLTIAKMVPKTDTVADVGCDHGKLAVWLVQNGHAWQVICGDISEKSLDKARRLAAAEGLSDRIVTRVGDGLAILTKGEADTAVIAGMGGELIVSILADSLEKTPDTLVLSCHTSAEVLRCWLTENGFWIEDEELLEEKGHFYPVMRARRGPSLVLTVAELEFGPALLRKKPDTLRRLVEKRIRKAREIRGRLETADSPRQVELLSELDKKLSRYEEVRKDL